MKTTNQPNSSRAFTLIELMIVVSIVGILLAVAIPSYRQNIITTRRSIAQADLVSLAAALERFRTVNNTYVNACTNTNVPDASVFNRVSPSDVDPNAAGATWSYNLTCTNLAANTFTVIATPLVGQPNANDGFLQLTSAGVKSWDADNNGALAADGSENFNW